MLSIVYGNPKKRLLVLPPISIIYSLIALMIIAAVLLLVDRVLLPYMADQGKIVGPGWVTDNSRIYDFMSGRNLADEKNPTWRSATYPVPTQAHPGEKRILVMGDSFVWGDGSANMNDIWWRRLQMELDRRGYHNVRVISAGLCGAATHRELTWAEQLVSVYKPDMIIWGYVTNDPEEGSEHSGQGIVKQIQLPKDEGFENVWAQATNVFPNFTRQLSGLRNQKLKLKFSGDKYGYDYNVWLYKILEGPNFAAYQQTVQRLANFVKEQKIPSMVMTLCMPWESEKAVTPVQKLFESNGMEFHNLLPALGPWYKHLSETGGVKGQLALAVNPANGHPGVTMTNYYARQAADILEKSYPQVLGEKTPEDKSAAAQEIQVNDFVPPSLSVTRPKENIFGMYFPTKESDFISMPIKRPYIQLNLAKPAALREITIAGKNVKSCGVALRSISRNNNDEVPSIHDLGTKKGGGGSTFKIPAESWAGTIDEILVTADVEGQDRVVLVKVEPQK